MHCGITNPYIQTCGFQIRTNSASGKGSLPSGRFGGGPGQENHQTSHMNFPFDLQEKGSLSLGFVWRIGGKVVSLQSKRTKVSLLQHKGISLWHKSKRNHNIHRQRSVHLDSSFPNRHLRNSQEYEVWMLTLRRGLLLVYDC